MAVLAGCGVEAAAEAAIHGLGRAEAAGLCDLVDRPVRRLQESAGGLEPNGFDVIRSGGANLGLDTRVYCREG